MEIETKEASMEHIADDDYQHGGRNDYTVGRWTRNWCFTFRIIFGTLLGIVIVVCIVLFGVVLEDRKFIRSCYFFCANILKKKSQLQQSVKMNMKTITKMEIAKRNHTWLHQCKLKRKYK